MNAALWILLLARGTSREAPAESPIDWIEFTATGAAPLASGVASEPIASGSGASPSASGSGRPLS